MPRPFPSVTVLTSVLGLVLFGCQSAPLCHQVGRLEHEVARLQSRGDRLEERLATVELAERERSRQSTEAQGAAVHSDPAPSQVRNKLAVVRVDPRARAPERDDQAFIEVESVDSAGSEPAVETSPALREYEQALALVKAGQYVEGARALSQFRERYPSHPHADNALYWSAECAYARGDYRLAERQFSELVELYPAGNKVPDALLKLGMTQRELGEEAAASESFTELRRRYPNTDAAARLEEARLR